MRTPSGLPKTWNEPAFGSAHAQEPEESGFELWGLFNREIFDRAHQREAGVIDHRVQLAEVVPEFRTSG
jgi:hypothetical protein